MKSHDAVMFLWLLAGLVALGLLGLIATWTYDHVVAPTLDRVFPTIDNGSAMAVILGIAAFPFGIYVYEKLHGSDRYVLVPAALLDVWFLYSMLRPRNDKR